MKLAVITGSNGQLGQQMIKEFRSKGWNIFGIDITHPSGKFDPDFFYEGSVSNRLTFESVFATIEKISQDFNRISLINNAGVAVFTPSEERTNEEIEYVTQINLNSVIYGITELGKFINKTRTNNKKLTAKVVNIASIYGIISPNSSIYTDTARNSSEIYGATKAGVIQMTRYFATKYANIPMSINCIAPGGVLNKEVQGEDFIKNYNNLVPQNRMCYSEEVAELTYFLSNNAIEYLSGQTIALDGGMSTW